MSAPRKIAIVGTAEPHWREAPFADETWEIWTCGGVYTTAPRSTRHIEIHRLSETCKGWGESPEQEAAARNVYVEWLRSRGPHVYAQPSPQLPDATPYPLQDVLKAFPDGYFTNSVSYMLALALLEGVSEIALYGVDMALSGNTDTGSDEYGQQRPSCEFYLGVAVGMGVQVHLPPQTTLLKCRKLYGFHEDAGFVAAAEAKVIELTERINFYHQRKLEARHAQFEAEKGEAAMKAALDVARYFKRNLEH